MVEDDISLFCWPLSSLTQTLQAAATRVCAPVFQLKIPTNSDSYDKPFKLQPRSKIGLQAGASLPGSRGSEGTTALVAGSAALCRARKGGMDQDLVMVLKFRMMRARIAVASSTNLIRIRA